MSFYANGMFLDLSIEELPLLRRSQAILNFISLQLPGQMVVTVAGLCNLLLKKYTHDAYLHSHYHLPGQLRSEHCLATPQQGQRFDGKVQKHAVGVEAH